MRIAWMTALLVTACTGAPTAAPEASPPDGTTPQLRLLYGSQGEGELEPCG